MNEPLAPKAEIGLCRENFSVRLVALLAKSLEEVVGLEDAEGFVTLVGLRMGHEIDNQYKDALELSQLSREQVAQVLVDLKRRIEGEFSISEESDEKIVLTNTRCPFGEQVIGRESLCMMTTNVFGRITASNLGYARVKIDRAIARGDDHCHVTVYLRPPQDGNEGGKEFFADRT